MAQRVEEIQGAAQLLAALTTDGAHPFTCFVGCVISCAPPTNAPSVEEVLNALLGELLGALDESPALRDEVQEALDEPAVLSRLRAVPFESLWERVARATGPSFVATVLSRLCSGVPPNYNHHAIAWLVKKGLIRTILTTNYDECIEEAIRQQPGSTVELRGKNELDPMVIEVSCLSKDGAIAARLLKLHGTISDHTSLAFMFSQITGGLSRQTKAGLQKTLCENPVLFAGYGCNDWDLQSLLATPLRSVWSTHHQSWSSIDERFRFVAEQHQSAWVRHDLREDPERSVFVQLARCTGWKEPVVVPVTRKMPALLESCDRRTRLEILAGLLDSLAVRITSRVYEYMARKHASATPDRNRFSISAFVTVAHDMSLQEQIQRGDSLLPSIEADDYINRARIRSQLAFAHFIGGSKVRGVLLTLRLLLSIRRLEATVTFAAKPALTWSPGERAHVACIAQARDIVAHNLLRAAWFHLPGALGPVARTMRRLGFRWVLARWALAVLSENRTWVSKLGDLASIGTHSRETAHALCLTGKWDEALTSAKTAEEALAWGRWFQWQANATRTRGWIWMEIGRRVKHLRVHALDDARGFFMEALDNSITHGTNGAEMVDDRIKARLEIKRLCILQGVEFDQDEPLRDDLEAVRARNPGAYARYRQMADEPPRSFEPLG